MGILNEDAVLIKLGKNPGEPSVVTIFRLVGLPSILGAFYFCQQSNVSWHPSIYLLNSYCRNRKGLLLGDTHTKERQIDTCDHLTAVLGDQCVSCEIELAGPEYESVQGFSSLPPTVADEFYRSEREAKLEAISSDTEKGVVAVDNELSPSHTLFQIQCVDQKGLFYDIMRTSKECNIQIAYGRFFSKVKGYRNMDLIVQTKDGKKIMDLKHQTNLCSRLKDEILCPLQVFIINRGPDAELVVANPIELSGNGRPGVFYDVTLALKTLGVCIFPAEIGRHLTLDRQWEVYRFHWPATAAEVRLLRESHRHLWAGEVREISGKRKSSRGEELMRSVLIGGRLLNVP